MKRIIALSLIMFAFLAAWANPIEVSSAKELKEAIEKNSSADIRLTNDIDLTQISTIGTTFKGVIDGEGTKVIDGKKETVFYSLHSGEGKNRVNHPIFENIDGATLKNLVIRNFRIEWDHDDIGAVAYTAKNCKFNKVILSEISIFNDDDNAGAIVGRAENCDFRNVKGMGNDVTVDGNRAGGFVGLSVNSVYCDCSNSAMSTVYSDGSWGNAYAGGFVGESLSDQFVFCSNFACVGALDDRIGGIAGYSTRSFFTNCTNSGYIMHCEEDDFITSTNNIKEQITADFIKTITDDLEKQYGKQDFDLTAGFASFIGTIGLCTASFGVELCLLSVAAASIGAFTVTIIIAATGIVVTLFKLIDAEIGAHDEMGGICGSCESGVFDCCSNYGTLMCRDSYVGGIVGLMRDMPTKSRITNCLNAGEIRGFESMGGIFGEGNPADVVTNCLNVGKLTPGSKDTNSDPIGCVPRGDYGVSRCYYLSDHTDDKATIRIPVTDEELKSGVVANKLNSGATSENAPWHQDIGKDEYPVPDPSHGIVDPQKYENVFAIFSVEDFDALRTAVNSGKMNSYVVYIEEDIDCNGITWEPIGTSAKPFSGVCYGNGHTISNLKTADDKNNNGVGFFGVVGINTEVHNLFIGSGSIVGGNGVGAIIGYCDHKDQTEGYIRIIGCGNAASITGNYDCGGLIGAIYSDKKMKLTIDNCFNMGNVTGNEKTAALCGYGKYKATITGCWNSGTVSGTVNGMEFARGESDITVLNCYSLNSTFSQTGVFTFTADDAKDGTLCYQLNGGSNDSSVGLPWEQDITSNEAYPHYSGYMNKRLGVYSSRAISGNYGTVILPYSVKSNDSIRYYTLGKVTVNDVETQFEFNAVDTLVAGTPAVFYFRGQKGSLYEFISINETFSKELNTIEKNGWTMTGNLSSKDIKYTDSDPELESIYFINNDAIRKATSNLTVSPYRAYLRTIGQTPAKTRAFFYDSGTLTDVQVVETDTKDHIHAEGIFNISGQPLGTIEKGINIIDGQLYYFDE